MELLGISIGSTVIRCEAGLERDVIVPNPQLRRDKLDGFVFETGPSERLRKVNTLSKGLRESSQAKWYRKGTILRTW